MPDHNGSIDKWRGAESLRALSPLRVFYDPAEKSGDGISPAKILIVEDDYFAALELEHCLSEVGFEVIGVAGTAEEAFEMAASGKPALAVMDIRLNGARDGIDAAIELLAVFNVPSIFATAHSDPQTKRRAEQRAKVQSKELKLRWRVFPYAIGLMRAVRDLQPFFVKLDIDGKPAWSGSVYQVSVGNGRFHGGGLTVAEDAAIDDGKLDLYLIYPGRFWHYLRPSCI